MKKYTAIKEVLAAYLENEKIRLRPSTYAIYERYLDNHIAPTVGEIRCSDLSKENVRRFTVDLLSEISVSTAKAVVSLLRCGLSESVPAGVFKVKLPKEPPKATKVFSQSQQKRLEDAAETAGKTIYTAIILCVYLGLRIGEVCALKWSDIDFSNRCLHIRRTVQRVKNYDKNGKKTRIIFQSPKSRASFRTIPVPGFLLAILKGAARESEFVISKDGSFIEPRTIQNRFKKVLKAAGLDDNNFHTLRHTFATRALEQGFDPKTLAEVMGHSSPTVTLNRYAHCLNEHKRKSMNRFSEVWKGGQNRQSRRLIA
jgi:integrase